MAASAFDSFSSPDAMALTISAVIFVITLVMLSFRFLSVLLISALLFFAVASGFAIARNTIVQALIAEHLSPEQQQAIAKGVDPTVIEGAKQQALTLFDSVVDTLANQPKKNNDQKPNTP